MPNIKSAAKRVKIAKKRTIKNRIVKSKIKSAVKEFLKFMEEGKKDEAKEALKNAIKTIDKAAGKGYIHKNTAARKKSKLQKQFNSAVNS